MFPLDSYTNLGLTKCVDLKMGPNNPQELSMKDSRSQWYRGVIVKVKVITHYSSKHSSLDIIVTDNNLEQIGESKSHLAKEFEIKTWVV